MKILKVFLALLILASLILSVKLILSFSNGGVIGPWQILLLCSLSAIPVFMGIWAIMKEKNDAVIQKKNIIWAFAILAVGAMWLYSIRRDQIKTTTKMMQIEQSNHK